MTYFYNCPFTRLLTTAQKSTTTHLKMPEIDAEIPGLENLYFKFVVRNMMIIFQYDLS